MAGEASQQGIAAGSRIGIIGGSFDPVHRGHLSIAQSALKAFSLARVIFVPAYCPPHKPRPDLAPFMHRLRMVELAISGMPFFEASGIEGREECPWYAGTTVEELKKLYGPDCSYYFIIGLDTLLTMTDTEKSRMYPGLCSFIATTRPGQYMEGLLQQVPPEFRPYVLVNEMPALSISSTDIRSRVRSGQPIDGMVPDSVRDYIRAFRIYTSCST
jgi:nicotinate-nucleotide adenylyltransferase